jgi:hypothetical protein
MPRRRHGLAVAFATVAGLTAPAGAQAATTYVVTREDDPQPVLACTTSNCSLRAAVATVNSGSGGDTISIPAGSYVLTDTQLVLSKDVTIDGAGARATTITTSGDVHRLFQIGAFATIRDVKLTGGNERWGGAALVDPGQRLDLGAAHVTGNVARGQAMGDPMYGGGILNQGGTLNVTGSTFSANQAHFSLAGSAFGGAIATRTEGTAGTTRLTNVTIFDNLARPGSGNGTGGGVYTGAGATTTITSSTIAGNRAESPTPGFLPEGGNLASAGSTQVLNTIVADGSAVQGMANCGPGITSLGHNLDSRDECGFHSAGDRVNANPQLGALGDNGGPTDTRAIPASSPAFNAGKNTGCPATDQRGVARPQGATCDIGAFEIVLGGGGLPGLSPAAPRLTDMTVRPRMFVLGNFLPYASQRRRRGTTIAFTLSEAATTTLTFRRKRLGRRVRGRCVKPRRRNLGRPRCRRTVVAGRIRLTLAAGEHRIRFSGRLTRRKRLRPGRYGLVVTARDAGGLTSAPARARLRAVAPKRR